MFSIAFELQANSLKLKKGPLPVTHHNPNISYVQFTRKCHGRANQRKCCDQQLATVADIIVCLGYRASIYLHTRSQFPRFDKDVWNVAHMEELGPAKRFRSTLGVGLLSPFMSSEDQQWDLEVSAVVDRVTEDISLDVPHPRTFHVHVFIDSDSTSTLLAQAQSVCQMYALYEIESVRHNENLQDLSTRELLSTIGRTSSVEELPVSQLINPPIQDDNPIVPEEYLYKINLSCLRVKKLTFNQHPSVLRGDAVVNWGRFVSEFVHSALSPQSVDILRFKPSLDVLFGHIIHSDSLKTIFDPRLA
ncbi:uncharacterized protein EDB93DRAFT_81411 [Suillus bovinus]|uniref:uncharacterized protein n=1 Tax=Suillus bovinus TaxID=48563 RepID=UPI001B85E6A9|nr:uncharacterized protein EDB93DRAFT_81411 [Suillus bovinus]KAG2130412.1 hypothetical protein EDB93DRAFT_81411 [Suillus bovinus]